MDREEHVAPVCQEHVDRSRQSRHRKRRQEGVEVLRHQDPAQRLEHHEHQEQNIHPRPEPPLRAVFTFCDRAEPLPVEDVVHDEQHEHGRSRDLMELLAYKRIRHEHGKQHHHQNVHRHAQLLIHKSLLFPGNTETMFFSYYILGSYIFAEMNVFCMMPSAGSHTFSLKGTSFV